MPPKQAGPTERQRRMREGRREREFYAYYESVLTHAGAEPNFCNLNDPQAAAAHTPTASRDTTLTSLTQLAALRLAAKRSMVFMFDATFAYIIAESTRSLSLADDSIHAPDDALWLGFTKIPRGLSVCEVTVDLPRNQGSNAGDADTHAVAHVVNNLAEDTRFCNQPYVHDGPKARFYAGVPITTPRGINIGAFCVLDDQPRDGLDVAQVDFLRTMAASVMSHLELVKAKQDNQRSHAMTSALGAFVDGKSEPADWWHRGARHPASHPNAHLRQQVETRTSFHRDPPSKIGPRASRGSGQRAERGNGESSSDAPPTSGKPLVVNGLPARIAAAMDRAAGLLRTALTADAVLFLDAILRGGFMSGAQGRARNGTDTDTCPTSDGGDLTRQVHDKSPDDPTMHNVSSSHSAILGAAFSPTGNAHIGQEKIKFPDQFLKGLLRRYPYGQIWHFDSNGDASDDKGYFPEELSSVTSATESAESDGRTRQTPADKRAAQKLRARVKSGRIIQDIFPGVRSFMIIGMWQHQAERFFGAAAVLSYSPTRIFSDRSELSYMAAFCDVVLAQVASLEAQEIGRSKNEFLSSISHELRSPLHGILGSSEYLLEREDDPTKLEMARSINSCGATLLDIINDLLEYSGLNHRPTKRKTAAHGSNSSEIRESEAPEMISTLTEEAVDIAYLSFEHQNSVQHGFSARDQRKPVALVLNIEAARSPDWYFTIVSAPWKRICLNLVMNALKYTPRGYVSVTLRKSDRPQDADWDHKSFVELVVEDSGIGMSRSFQDNDLFRAFKQEDSLTPGTGLGLNLVANIVKSMDGTVHVQSEVGSGTTVTVSVPLLCRSPAHPLEQHSKPQTLSHHSWHVDLVGFHSRGANAAKQTPEAEADTRFVESLKRYCEELGLTVQPYGEAPSLKTNLNIIRESGLEHAYPSHRSASRSKSALGYRLQTPTIIICQNRASAIRLRSTRAPTGLPDKTSFLWPPISSAKLSSAVSILMMSPVGSQQESLVSDKNDGRSRNFQGKSVPEYTRRRAQSDIMATSDDELNVSSKFHESTSLRLLPDQGDVLTQLPHLTRSGSEPMPSPTAELTASMLSSSNLPTAKDHVVPVPIPAATHLSLLLVDDNAINLRILEAFAKKGGHSYRKACNGQEAVDLYQRGTVEHAPEAQAGISAGSMSSHARKPTIILMDINMPVLDGFGATRAIREFESTLRVPRAVIIAVTGLGDTNAQDEAFACGMDLFLTKPVRMKDLNEVFAGLDL